MHPDILAYHEKLSAEDKQICQVLSTEIDSILQGCESKVWHGHPVWFMNGNPLVGYSKLKHAVRLLFWSGQTFDEPHLEPEGSFKAAEARFTNVDQIVLVDLRRWLRKSMEIQWDYKNIVKRKGELIRIG